MKRDRRLVFLLLALISMTPVVLGTATQLENHDPFCGSCHTEPESTYLSRKQRPARDLASAHGEMETPVRCIDCHSGSGLQGRAASLFQGASDLAAFLKGGYDQPASTKHPVGDEGCTKCHPPISPGGGRESFAEIGGKSHYHEESYLAAWADRRRNPYGTCAVCHVAHWDGGLAATGFRNNLFVQESCEDCHQSLAGWLPPEKP